MVRDPRFPARRSDQRGRIAVDDSLAPQVAPERADGGQLARGGRLRVPAFVEIANEGARAEMIEVLRRQLRHAPSDVRAKEREVLGEVALIRAHGVRRGVLVQTEMLEKRFDEVSNHSARSLSARSEIAALRSFLLFTRPSSGGITPQASLYRPPMF